ncbi:DUF1801 domain-containing protein [Agrococcus sp. 1P02AA]|uniref:iron chaperone n=1 Tax=Agrococcus sp. 1P02AA TaxID=3132259 RepID=UPI0039A59806
MAETATSIDEYLAGVDPAFRAELQRIRKLVTELVPSVEETISYRMPTLRYRGRALVHFTASKRHMTLYPSSWAIEELAERLEPYETTEHGIRFTAEQPLPTALIEDLVRFHAAQIDADRH